jgi:hypothetical protein
MTGGVPIPPPPTSDTPDKYTASAPDYSSVDRAENRVLFINTNWFKFGTADKSQAAALVLSVVLLATAVLVCVVGLLSLLSGKEPKWVEIVISWIGNAFLFTAGIAVGAGGQKSKPPTD